jgi:tRNA-specific 2-thiouridylase
MPKALRSSTPILSVGLRQRNATLPFPIFHLMGQRKGIGIAAAEPLYVVKLDPVMNRVIVGNRESAVSAACLVGRMNWVSIAEPTTPIRAQVQVRYRSPAVPVNVIPLENNQVKLVFDEPQFSITPGQAAVIYEGEIVLGGGIISGATPNGEPPIHRIT